MGAEILGLLLILIIAERLLKFVLSYLLDRMLCHFLVFYCYVSLHYINLLIIATPNFSKLELLIDNNTPLQLAVPGVCSFLLVVVINLCKRAERFLDMYNL